jgi:hypothetical protein
MLKSARDSFSGSPDDPKFNSCLNQRSNQAQQFLLFWPIAGGNEKSSDLNVGGLTARGKVGLMPNEHPTGLGIAGEEPPIPGGGTAVNLSELNGHACVLALPQVYRRGRRSAKPAKRRPSTACQHFEAANFRACAPPIEPTRAAVARAKDALTKVGLSNKMASYPHDTRLMPFTDRVIYLEDGRIVRKEKKSASHQ